MISQVEAWTSRRTGLGASLNSESLHLWQLEMLWKIIAYARDNGRFYGEKLRGADVGSFLSRADLERLPFTWPADVERDPLEFLCVSQNEIARVTTLMTSGTSHLKKRIFFTKSDLLRTVDFFEHGMQCMVEAGQRVLILMSGETEFSIGRLLQTALARMDVMADICARGWGASEALAAARTADCIVGIPGEIIYLCRCDRSLRPQSVLLSADYVPECVIAAIGEAWHCRVFSHYGMTETGFGCAVQCALREGHHLRDADLLIEIVGAETGTPLATGERGEIVITTLRNEAMPLIRYRTGDMARMNGSPCGCGGVLPRLGIVEGRRENDIPLGGGNALSIHRLDEIMFAIPAVRSFAAELNLGGGRSTLLLTVDSDGYIEQRMLKAKLPDNLEVDLRYGRVDPFANRAKRRIHMIGA